MDWNGEITEKTIISTTVGKNALEEIKWSRSQSQQKSPKCSTWVQSQKRQNELGSLPRQAIQVYAPITNAKEDKVEWFYEDLQGSLELTPKKKMSFSS